MNAPVVYIEIRQSSLKLLLGNEGVDVALQRLENGRLDPLSLDGLKFRVSDFLKKHGARPGLRACCAIGARGVSLRRITLPKVADEEFQRLLLLQIEREFPLSPDELAWGYRALQSGESSGHGASQSRQWVVVAAKKDLLQEYADVLSSCDLIPQFTLSALARSCLVPQPPASYTMLDIGRSRSELICFEEGAPGLIRVLPCGEEKLPDEPGLETIAKSLPARPPGQKIYVTGPGGVLTGPAAQLVNAVGGGVACERIETAPGEGRSAAISGLKKSNEENGEPLLLLGLKAPSLSQTTPRPNQRKWATIAGLLLLASVSLRYAEAVIQKPRLSRRIAEIQSYREKLPQVDRELGFLHYLKTNQPPYLDSLFVMANAAPPGSRIDTISMNRRGDVAFRASMRDSQQVGEFRSKLINSGWFSTVVVDEQSPSPDKEKVLARITGQWKPSLDRNFATNQLASLDSEKAKSAAKKKPTATSEIQGTPAPSLLRTAAPPKAAKK